MDIESRVDSRRVLLGLRGNWGDGATAQLREVTRTLLDRGVIHFTLDLSGMTDLDGTVVAPLVDLFKRVNAHWGDVTLVGLPEDLRTIFKATQLHKVFDLVEPPVQLTTRKVKLDAPTVPLAK